MISSNANTFLWHFPQLSHININGQLNWLIYFDINSAFEPRHDKTNKVTVCPAKTQISLGIRWAHNHFVGFVMSRLIYVSTQGYTFLFWNMLLHLYTIYSCGHFLRFKLIETRMCSNFQNIYLVLKQNFKFILPFMAPPVQAFHPHNHLD